MKPILFEPVAYDHAAWLIGRRPWDVSRDGALLVQAFQAVIDRYRPRSCVVGIDLYNVEAEALGCRVEEPAGHGSPTITQAVCSSADQLRSLQFDPEHDGRMPMLLDAAATLKGCRGNCDVRIPLCGPFSLAGHLLGLENLLCSLLTDHQTTCRALLHLSENLVDYARAAAARGLGVTIFESAATPPLVSPALFASAVVPALRRLLDQASVRAGERPHFIMGGNVLLIAEELLSLAPSYVICPIETDQREFLRRMASRTDIFVRVNMAPRAFAQSDPAPALAEARRAAEIAALRPRTSVGIALPIDAAAGVVEAVARFLDSGGDPAVGSGAVRQ